MIATVAFAVVPVQDSDTGSWSFGVLKNPGQYCAVPVSYTHLDVYKRQLMEHEGLPVPQLIDRLIALALERKEKQHG